MVNKISHVAIIMDGNGRWAKKRLLPRIAGHKQGLQTAKKIVKSAYKHNVKELTLFAFSSENWGRPQAEVSFLIDLLYKMLTHELNQLHSNNVRLRIVGELKQLSLKINDAIYTATQTTKNNTGLILNIAFNYGGRYDIVQAVKKIAQSPEYHKNPELITERVFSDNLLLSDPCLLIRTSGENRISNFMNWQLSYSEMFFVDKNWPEFSVDDFEQILRDFNVRERRFGKVKTVIMEKENACN